MAARGWHVALVARQPELLADAAAACTGAASVTVLPTDVGEDEAVSECFARVLDDHGRVDVVVNCAAVLAYGRTEEVPPEVFERVLRTNLLGSVNVARHSIRTFRRQQEGTLVLVGSIAGHLAAPGMSSYVVGKHGVRALARQLRVENVDMPEIRVRYAAPGGVDTPIYRQAANYLGAEGAPPPPVASAERVGAQLMALVERRRAPEQLALTNHLLRGAFTVAPRIYDAVAGPAVRLALTDQRNSVPPNDGNVMQPTPDRVRGDAGHQGTVGRTARIVADVAGDVRNALWRRLR